MNRELISLLCRNGAEKPLFDALSLPQALRAAAIFMRLTSMEDRRSLFIRVLAGAADEAELTAGQKQFVRELRSCFSCGEFPEKPSWPAVLAAGSIELARSQSLMLSHPERRQIEDEHEINVLPELVQNSQFTSFRDLKDKIQRAAAPKPERNGVWHLSFPRTPAGRKNAADVSAFCRALGMMTGTLTSPADGLLHLAVQRGKALPPLLFMQLMTSLAVHAAGVFTAAGRHESGSCARFDEEPASCSAFEAHLLEQNTAQPQADPLAVCFVAGGQRGERQLSGGMAEFAPLLSESCRKLLEAEERAETVTPDRAEPLGFRLPDGAERLTLAHAFLTSEELGGNVPAPEAVLETCALLLEGGFGEALAADFVRRALSGELLSSESRDAADADFQRLIGGDPNALQAPADPLARIYFSAYVLAGMAEALRSQLLTGSGKAPSRSLERMDALMHQAAAPFTDQIFAARKQLLPSGRLPCHRIDFSGESESVKKAQRLVKKIADLFRMSIYSDSAENAGSLWYVCDGYLPRRHAVRLMTALQAHFAAGDCVSGCQIEIRNAGRMDADHWHLITASSGSVGGYSAARAADGRRWNNARQFCMNASGDPLQAILEKVLEGI